MPCSGCSSLHGVNPNLKKRWENGVIGRWAAGSSWINSAIQQSHGLQKMANKKQTYTKTVNKSNSEKGVFYTRQNDAILNLNNPSTTTTN